ncbi:DegT/DnrJ/EryC1/StrS family aminotransferase, partial [Variovorax sp. 2RAF20]
ADIDARVFFWPLSALPMFADKPVHTPMAFSLSERAINLPSYHDMSEADIDRVAETLISVVRSHQDNSAVHLRQSA